MSFEISVSYADFTKVVETGSVDSQRPSSLL